MSMKPDYLKDFAASRILANKIERYWHTKGYLHVKAWVEKELMPYMHYTVRTNIRFKEHR